MNSMEKEGEGRQLLEAGEQGARKGETLVGSLISSENTSSPRQVGKFAALLEGIWLILSSTYLLQVCAFLWLTAVVSSFFYFEVCTFLWTVDFHWTVPNLIWFFKDQHLQSRLTNLNLGALKNVYGFQKQSCCRCIQSSQLCILYLNFLLSRY